VKVIQRSDGYRFSLDPILLCGFARVGEGMAVADLGTGSGVIPLLLARRSGAGRIVGVEIQPEMAERARRSVGLNKMEERVEILELDVRSLRGRLDPQGFDVVLSNPPFRRGGTGRQAPVAERAAARHERAGGLEDFLMGAAYLLKDGGRCYFVHLAERLAELLALMRQCALEPKRLRCVHSRSGESARLVMVEGVRRGRPGLCVEPPLFVYEGKKYSPEVEAMYGEG
jgi:tRNA1Val (adenine37-N6)-methyltransferase